MSRLRLCLILIAIIPLSSCEDSVAPVPLRAEEQAATGTYTLTLANSKTPPTKIGTFLSGGAGADVMVTGATLMLDSNVKTRSTSRLNVTVEYVEFDAVQGVQRRNVSSETVAPWSLSGSTLSIEAGSPTLVITAGTLSGRTVTVTTSSPGFYGAASPTVVLTLVKQ